MVPTFHSVGSRPLIRCIIAISVSLSLTVCGSSRAATYSSTERSVWSGIRSLLFLSYQAVDSWTLPHRVRLQSCGAYREWMPEESEFADLAAFHSLGGEAIPDIVHAIAGGHPPELVWRNQPARLTFRVD